MASQITILLNSCKTGWISLSVLVCMLFLLSQLSLSSYQLKNNNINNNSLVYWNFLRKNSGGDYAAEQRPKELISRFQIKDSFRNLSQAAVGNFQRQDLQSKNQTHGKMAYFLLMSKNEREKVVRLFQKINAPQNIYIIHLDKKMDTEELEIVTSDIQQLNNTYKNLYLLPQYQVSYLGIASIDIELTAMAHALSISMHWTHYMIISPSDYPLLTQTQISTILSHLPPNASFLEAELMSCSHINNRIQKFRFDTAIAGQSNNKNEQIKFKVPIREDLKLLKGSQWKLLSREMVKYFVYSEDGWGRRMLVYFSGSHIPTEHYYETTACNSPNVDVRNMVRIGEVTFKSWHEIDWAERSQTGGSLGPNNMNEKYLKWALTQGRFFARKFQYDEDSQYLKDLLDRMHEGEEIRVQNASFTKENVFKRTQGYFKWVYQTQTCQKLLQQQQIC